MPICTRKDKSQGDFYKSFGFFLLKKGGKMHWIHLFTAGIFEVVWAIGLKYSNGFTVLIPSVITTIFMIASYYFLALALKSLPIGTAYAIWTGIGTVGTVILGIFLFKEPVTAMRLICTLMILSGIIGLKIL